MAIAIGLHWSAISIAAMGQDESQSSSGYQKYLPVVALIILVVIFVPQTTSSDKSARSDSIAEMEQLHHLGLAGSNVVTMLGALYLKRDNETTSKQIRQLENSKYKYKSL